MDLIQCSFLHHKSDNPLFHCLLTYLNQIMFHSNRRNSTREKSVNSQKQNLFWMPCLFIIVLLPHLWRVAFWGTLNIKQDWNRFGGHISFCGSHKKILCCISAAADRYTPNFNWQIFLQDLHFDPNVRKMKYIIIDPTGDLS
jgi:hypothetical protein